jgi:hypothetical protein
MSLAGVEEVCGYGILLLVNLSVESLFRVDLVCGISMHVHINCMV